MIISSIVIVIATKFTFEYSKNNSLKQELKNKTLRLQTVKFNIQKRLSYAIKGSIKTQNQSIIFNAINYESLIGSYNNSKWNTLSFYDKNLSTSKNIKVIDTNLSDLQIRLQANKKMDNLYLKFNNSTSYHKIECFNCSNIKNSISLQNLSDDFNASNYFNITSSSYAIALENNILYLYYDFKDFFNQDYSLANKSILIKNVQSFKIKNNYMEICLSDKMCVVVSN